MSLPQRLGLTAHLQVLACKLANRLEHRVARCPVRLLGDANQAMFEQSLEPVEDRDVQLIPGHSFARVKRPATAEHCQSTKERRFISCQEVVTPDNRVPE